jgi:hypothetical protein
MILGRERTALEFELVGHGLPGGMLVHTNETAYGFDVWISDGVLGLDIAAIRLVVTKQQLFAGPESIDRLRRSATEAALALCEYPERFSRTRRIATP